MQIDFIKPSQVNEYLNQGAQFIDLRDRQDYEQKHIKHALSIPFDQFEERYQSLPKNRTYVLYCERGGSSTLAAKKMLSQGYRVLSLSGGIVAFFRKK
ncbi:MAG: rhodanese-like domain-containing protein [Lachnospiraceae bacterium]|nr:rhodanese-like domain-containing protein [Lachnospiraceae bacterium]